MPRVTPLSPALRKAEAERQQKDRTIKIINTACCLRGFDRQILAKKADIDYPTLCRRLRGESEFRAQELCNIADALTLDVFSRAALLGAKEKCRYEPGYKERRETSIG